MKLFLAGADFDRHQEMIYLANHPNFLTTFFKHQKGFNQNWIDWYNKTNKEGASWIMDSGLFTMMFGAGSGETYNEKDLLEYTYNYLNQVKGINYKDYIVEMDVHKVLGVDKLKKFRGIFEKEYDIEKTIYVWHKEEGQDGFDKLCKRYPYIAISIPELRKVLKGKNALHKTVSHMIGRANKINPNIKIHLLGCTQQGLMEQSGYYSSDSTSWMSGGRYGTGVYFDMNRIQQYNIHTKKWKRYTNEHIVEFKKLKEKFNIEMPDKDYYNIMYLGCKAYSELNQYINNRHFAGEVVKKLW